MKHIMRLLLILSTLAFSGCSTGAQTQETSLGTFSPTPAVNKQNDTFSPTPTVNKQNDTLEKDIKNDIYCFDASKEWDAKEYEKKYSQKLSYFNAPIESPYKYNYKCETKDMTIDEIAKALGIIMMEDMSRDYEGKTFTVTEYKNLEPDVMDDVEFAKWEEYYSKNAENVELKENQWLCTYSCEYKYTGVFANIGEMPQNMEWKIGMAGDGSGEDDAFIIQKVSDDEYILRGLPKTIRELNVKK